MKHFVKSENGQVAIFFIVGFSFFLILLSLVANTAILSAQKMKLQNTLDLAVKAATQVQANHLNTINRYNEAIHSAWVQLEVMLNSPFLYAPCGSLAICCIPPKGTSFGKLNCPKLDKARRLAFFTNYWKVRTTYALNIKEHIAKANEKAWDAALNIALKSHNMPVELRNAISKNYGGALPSSEKLAQIYTSKTFDFKGNGKKFETLEDRYGLSDQIKQIPLFDSEDASKLVLYLENDYFMCPKPCPTAGIPPVTVPSPGYRGQKFSKKKYLPPIPSIKGKYYKIKHVDDTYLPHFAAVLSYTPIWNLNIFSIFRTDRNKNNEKSETLLYSEAKTMRVISKGMPQGGNINSGSNYDYAKSRLIGLADFDAVNVDSDKDLKAVLH